MGLELRRWICGRCWGRALAPPSSAEGERCGCLGPSEVAPGTGTVVRSSGRKETLAEGPSDFGAQGRNPSGELGKADWAVESGPCGGDGTPVYRDGETPWKDRK